VITKRQLTEGEWCIENDENVAIDQKNRLIYFTGYKDPIESHL